MQGRSERVGTSGRDHGTQKEDLSARYSAANERLAHVHSRAPLDDFGVSTMLELATVLCSRDLDECALSSFMACT